MSQNLLWVLLHFYVENLRMAQRQLKNPALRKILKIPNDPCLIGCTLYRQCLKQFDFYLDKIPPKATQDKEAARDQPM
ncbi:hypothetical protein JCM12294_47220 [Desulfocicer niacini]